MRTPDPDRIAEIYRRITESGRDEVFITLRGAADVDADYRATLAAGGPLAGLVLAVKDNVDVAGLPTTAACPGYTYTPEADAPAVAALRAAGAVVIGKTNLDQFATGLVGTRSPYGAVRDAHRPDYISGGSSSGSAVAVALGFADIAIGTDTAGSGRVPAGLQGIVGIKATLGVVSTAGVVPACASYDCVTIFARDLATAQDAMAAMSCGAPQRDWPANTPLAAATVPRIAIPAELPGLDPAWREAFGAAVARAEAAGMMVTEIPMDEFFAAADLLYNGALVAERFAAVGEFVTAAGSDAGLDPTVAAIVTGGKDHSAVDLLAGVSWVPYFAPTFPFHGQVTQWDASPIPVDASFEAWPGSVVECSVFMGKADVRFEDYLAFDENQPDFFGMPAVTIHYAFTPADQERLAQAVAEAARMGSLLGQPINGLKPVVLPHGASLHYQGTVRLGTDDQTSTVDTAMRVWGCDTVYVGGNGVIPTPAACNPTLTNVALAVLGARDLAGRI